jgi:transmembrane sensor
VIVSYERATKFRRYAIAAIVSVLVVGGLVVGQRALFRSAPTPSPVVYSTEVGEQKEVPLADGSVMRVNTASRLAVSYTPTERDVKLLEGEALFEVAHDRSRPFRVKAGEVTVEAVGTRFNVYRQPDRITVAVVEGKVAIRSQDKVVRAGKGSLMQAGPDGNIVPLSGSVQQAVSWNQGRVTFESATLGEIVAELNRYTRARYVVQGEAAKLKFRAVSFFTQNPESFLQSLSEFPDIEVERSDKRILIHAKDESEEPVQ